LGHSRARASVGGSGRGLQRRGYHDLQFNPAGRGLISRDQAISICKRLVETPGTGGSFSDIQHGNTKAGLPGPSTLLRFFRPRTPCLGLRGQAKQGGRQGNAAFGFLGKMRGGPFPTPGGGWPNISGRTAGPRANGTSGAGGINAVGWGHLPTSGGKRLIDCWVVEDGAGPHGGSVFFVANIALAFCGRGTPRWDNYGIRGKGGGNLGISRANGEN